MVILDFQDRGAKNADVIAWDPLMFNAMKIMDSVLANLMLLVELVIDVRMATGIYSLEMDVKNVTVIEQVLWHLFATKILASVTVSLVLEVNFVISVYQVFSCSPVKDAGDVIHVIDQAIFVIQLMVDVFAHHTQLDQGAKNVREMLGVMIPSKDVGLAIVIDRDLQNKAVILKLEIASALKVLKADSVISVVMAFTIFLTAINVIATMMELLLINVEIRFVSVATEEIALAKN